MTYYTDNNQIKELMLETANVEVNDLNALVSNRGVSTKDVTVYIFDTTLFFLHLPDTTVRSDVFLARRPDWGGLILELIKNEKVYLF